MKLMIASDIHGSAYYCRKLLEAYDREKAGRMVILGDILLHGHTHVPVCREHEDYIYMNPGSVSIPKENSAHSYMTYEDGLFQWKDLDGNVYMKYGI